MGGLLHDAGLITPRCPVRPPITTTKQLEKRPRAARFDDAVEFAGLARMFTLARRQQVYLPPPRRERAGVSTARTEQDQLGHVAEVEADTAAVGAAVFANFVPGQIGSYR